MKTLFFILLALYYVDDVVEELRMLESKLRSAVVWCDCVCDCVNGIVLTSQGGEGHVFYLLGGSLFWRVL